MFRVKTLGYQLDFEYKRNSNLDAELLSKHINDNLHDLIGRIRKQAYNEGWKDAKNKKVRKKTQFNRNLVVNDFIGY